MSVEDLKAVLRDTLWGTERGLDASSDTRAEVNELLSRLEGRNPTPLPNEALDKLNGTWRLAYTSNSELVALLALGRLPLLGVGDITQVVDGGARTVENRVALTAPFSRTQVAATASFEVRSAKLLSVEFREGRVATPELLADVALPAELEILGQRVDLAPLQAALEPLDGPLRALVAQIGAALAGVPDLRFPIPAAASKPGAAATWLLNTYLDADLRISRGDGGSVFVMVKEQLPELPEAVEHEAAAAAPAAAPAPAVAAPAPADGEVAGFFDE
jgi:hypothetical protein